MPFLPCSEIVSLVILLPLFKLEEPRGSSRLEQLIKQLQVTFNAL